MVKLSGPCAFVEIECSGRGVLITVSVLSIYSDSIFFLEQVLIICIFLGNCHFNYVSTYKYVAFTLMLLEIPFDSVGKFKKFLMLIYVFFPLIRFTKDFSSLFSLFKTTSIYFTIFVTINFLFMLSVVNFKKFL